ncbi:glutathione S-transferase N-terminal domain-containing protein [Conexibacter sp. SYSU D00693]|uniref:glutathione S-transferase N-terminal domain-containing protein n=1 Tax=Conexibacter sp. SYSU D00693 TaxID=2812560 RepID=UPI00196AA1E5|nr:glutathione S-transferase N-terminal domain-containing protein [Conexibacter sp. SYSU D00693]
MTTTLLRCRTPTDWLCPCGRVARELRKHGEEVEEVRVPFSKRDRDRVVQASGQAKVPVAVIDGEAICDSLRIVEHLRWRAGDRR